MMRTQSVPVKIAASVATFLLLAYCFDEYSQALRVAMRVLSTEADLLSRTEYKVYSSRSYIYELGWLISSAVVLTPAVLGAIYTYLSLSVGWLRFSLRNVFFIIAGVAMFLVFGRRIDQHLATESDIETYIVGAGYGALMLLVTWVLIGAIGTIEKMHPTLVQKPSTLTKG